MNIEITARHFTASLSLKEFIYEKIKKITKYNSAIMSCHVILTKENKGKPKIGPRYTFKASYFRAQEELGGPPQHRINYFL